MKTAFLSVLAVALAGCTILHSTTRRETDPKTGVTVETTHATGWTILDGNASLAKFSNHSSPTTNANGVYGPGTYASGVNQASSGSNLVLIISGVSGAVVQGAVQGIK